MMVLLCNKEGWITLFIWLPEHWLPLLKVNGLAIISTFVGDQSYHVQCWSSHFHIHVLVCAGFFFLKICFQSDCNQTFKGFKGHRLISYTCTCRLLFKEGNIHVITANIFIFPLHGEKLERVPDVWPILLIPPLPK